jgi:hypothetical protein
MFFLLFKFCTTHYQLIHVKAYDLVQVVDDSSGITLLYHIFCCNMFVFACPIIARSQCWLFALAANICICPQISVFAPEFNFRYLRSGLKDYVKVQGKMVHKDMLKIAFQSN